MESTNIFFEMNSDISKVYQNNKQYLKALNMRPVTTLGGSNGSLENIKGNNLEFVFPLVRDIYKLKLSSGTLTGVVTIIVNGESKNFNTNLSTTNDDLLSHFRSYLGCYNGVYDSNKSFAVCKQGEYVFVYMNPEYQTSNIINSVATTITISNAGGDITPEFYDINENTSATQVSYIVGNNSSDPLMIIGSTNINNYNYILTCTKINSAKTGQIWEVYYDDVNKFTNVKLLYHNILSFSINHPIPPSAITGRYELPNLQRIYFTDNNNPVRIVNVKDPNLMGLSVDLVDSRSSISMSIPTLSDVINGNAVTPISSSNTYQMSYRLRKNNNNTSNFSIPSALVTPVAFNTDEFKQGNVKYASLNGVANTINKSLEWRIGGIDTSFDTIECYIIIRELNAADVFKIFLYEEKQINGATVIKSEFKNDVANFTEITQEEFFIENSLFTHAKTIEQKDNRLFYANIKNGLSDAVENYDSRTFRFVQGTNTVSVKEFETDPTGTLKTVNITSNDDYTLLSETADNIPAYNLHMSVVDEPDYDPTANCQLNSNVIGGTGRNISYSFGSVLIKSDEAGNMPLSSGPTSFYDGSAEDDASSNNTYKNGYRRAGVSSSTFNVLKNSYTNGSTEQLYTLNTIKETMALEFLNGQFRGYQCNEIYRFGIVFYSKTGSAYFVKHIGDIKFPNYSDSIDTALRPKTDSGTFVNDFRSMVVDGNEAYSNVPYINFNINITAELSKVISGYQIVRVKRSDSDKTIAAQGLITQVAVTNSNVFNLPDAQENLLMAAPTGTSAGNSTDSALAFQSFDYLVNKSGSNIETNDKIIVTEKYRIFNNGGTASLVVPFKATVPNNQRYGIYKFYNLVTNFYTPNTSGTDVFKVNSGTYFQQNESLVLPSGKIYINRDQNVFPSAPVKSVAAGSPTIIVEMADNINWEQFNAVGSDVAKRSSGISIVNCKLLALHFKPSRLKTQYGGRTYISRSTNKYMSCAAFYKIDDTPLLTSIKVFGGDTFYGIVDNQKALKQYDTSFIPNGIPNITSVGQVWFFPSQSTMNVDTRIGIKANSNLNDENSVSALTLDTYDYNRAFSLENTLHEYLSKPVNFNVTSEFFNKIVWSEPKINGETDNSWVNIPVDNFYYIDGNYGPITALVAFRDHLHCVQENGFARLQVNPVAITSTQDGSSLEMATGVDVLKKHNYISIDTGSRHQWSVAKSPGAITFTDTKLKKIFLYDGSQLMPVSDVKGNRGVINKVLNDKILRADNPVNGEGILVTYDYVNSEFLFTFHNKIGTDETEDKYTLVYSDLTGTFTSFYSFKPYIYINNHGTLYSPTNADSLESTKLYLHNVGKYGEFYGIVYPSSIKVVTNSEPYNMKTKLFDNLTILTESINVSTTYNDDINDNISDSLNIPILNDTFSRIRCYNEYQNTDWVSLTRTPGNANLRRSEQGWNIQVPRNKVNYDNTSINVKSIFDPTVLTKTTFGERIRDKYLVIDLEYDNTNNNRFILHSLTSLFKISDR